MDDAVADIFGYHALQLGMPRIEGLRTNRMPHQWLALGEDGLAWLPGARPAGQAPASTLPGPHSPMRPTPRAASACTQPVHCTGR